MNSEKDTQKLAIFKDQNFNYLYKKTEKISTALYMITNFFTAEEPLKWEIRKKTVTLLDSVMKLGTTSLSGRDQIMREISTNLFQIISIFEMSFRSGFISMMNYEILSKELDNLVNFIIDIDDKQLNANSKLFNRTFFEEKLPKRQEEIIKPLIKDNNYLKDIKRQISVFDDKKTYNKDINNFKDTNNIKENKNRRSQIIEIIKEKGNVNVKDISEEITGVSEKTLQRELLKMVEDGILKKEGERRWSRYTMF
jgi:DNA-binding transcriptional ArsR family regulator